MFQLSIHGAKFVKLAKVFAVCQGSKYLLWFTNQHKYAKKDDLNKQ